MDKAKRKKVTFFPKRIKELQLLRGYSTNYVMENLFFDDGEPVINDRQVLDKYKSGQRAPQYFEDTLKAFAKFYDVSTDFLLGADDVPNRQIKSVQEVTGLSEDAIRRLTQLKDQCPDILAMVDAIIAGTEEDADIADYITLYNQIFEDYKETTGDKGVSGLAVEMYKIQKRFFLTQALYAHWQRVVTAKLAPKFDREIVLEEDHYQYEHSQEFFDTIPDSDPREQITITNIIVTLVEDDNSDK